MSEWDHLVVDGYNVLNSCAEFRPWMDLGIDAARDQLATRIAVLHDFDGLRTTIVFDGKGCEIAIERPRGHLTFSYVYAPLGATADSIIEQLVSTSGSPDRIVVATRDNMLRETVYARGATVWSPEGLMQEADRAEKRQADWLRRRGREFG